MSTDTFFGILFSTLVSFIESVEYVPAHLLGPTRLFHS